VEGNSAYTGTTGGEALIYKLVDRTDDAIMFGPNNYQLLMKLISAACIKSPAAVDYCVGSTDVAQFTTVINWKDSYLLSNPPAGHIEYVVELKTSGKVSYTTKTARRVVTYVQAGEPVEVVEWDESTTAVELSPFSFVILNNTSNLSMIGDVMNGAGPQMVPALMLKYCADKQFNDNAITACAVALDIVGVVTGPGLITAALRAGRLAVAAFEAVQLLGAAGNLVANNVNSPGLQAVINKYNAIVGIWGLARIATAGTRYTLDYFTAAKSNQLSTITTVIAEEYAGLYDAVKAEIDAAPEALKKPLSKMKELVRKGVSGGGWIDELELILGGGTKTKITNWINAGLDESKLATAFANTSDKAALFNKLETAKSIYHQRVHIADWDNIPGVVDGPYNSNGLPEITIPSGVNSNLDLAGYRATTFSNIEFVNLVPGTKLYRVTDEGGEAGGYWTLIPPDGLDDVIGATAVMPEWNGFGKIIEYTVPEGGIKVWKGTAAAQPVSLEYNIGGKHLGGGGVQIFIPDFYRMDPITKQPLGSFMSNVTPYNLNPPW
jgi:hypothetical protein